MEHEGLLNEQSIEHARRLVEELERGDEAAARHVIDELARARDHSLYLELGKLTRQLHEALNSFQLDSRLALFAEHEIPDARDRLNYVISMTDQAANRTLSAVEECSPACERMEREADELAQEWQRFTRREMQPADFRALSKRLGLFLESSGADARMIRGHLTEVLMAQDFQDLTGQIIRRVIQLVEDLEKNLVNLVRISGQARGAEPRAEALELQGPPVPGKQSASTVNGQDEVDDLLSSLGF